MKKVNELSSLELDYWVAKAEGILAELRPYGYAVRRPFDPEGPATEFSGCHNWMWLEYSPSKDWAQGGPIIERERLSVSPAVNTYPWGSRADNSRHPLAPKYGYGETALIAAMRCYVASVYGDEV